MKRIDRRGMLRLSAAGAVAASGTVAMPRRKAQAAATKPSLIILSCDGGGVRGLITAMLLRDLDPGFLKKVSLFAGTSTGSVIALGLAAGVPIEQIVALYRSMANCREIFTPYLSAEQLNAARAALRAALAAQPAQPAAQIDWTKVWELIAEAIAELAYPKYKSSGLRTLLEANLPSLTLRDLASQTGKLVVAPSFQINGVDAATGKPVTGWRPVLFHNLPGLDTPPDLGGTSLVDAAMCSAAAPLFFPPHDIAEGGFVDGGIAANDPCAAAIAAALASSLGNGLTADMIAAVSIGTGNIVNFFPPSDAIFPFGILGWLWPKQQGATPAFPLIEALFAGSSGIGDLIASMLLRQSTYIRVNPTFNEAWSLDDCSAIEQMIDLTQRYLGTKEWQHFKQRIDALAAI
jgi:predicted acylesterase/phospholipase RssA